MTAQQKVGGHFQIISELSKGGFGQTFLAEDLRRSEHPKCVVKQLKPQTEDAEVINLSKRLFEQEVRILYQIGAHPQIPSIITHFEEAAEFYFVQEYIEGNTFAEELAQGKVFSQGQVVEIVAELLSVLAFVHSRGVIHRDVKPSNLICRSSDGKTVLIDFGAVKQVGNQTALNPNQATKGTIAIGSEGYMPMEQLAGHPRFSSDVYAAGMFAIQLLTQTHPSELRQNQRTGEWIWQDKVTVNNQFAEFLNQMIRYDFRQRFTDAVAALMYLKRLNLNFRKTENKTVTKAANSSPAFIPPEANPQAEVQPAMLEPTFMPEPPPTQFVPPPNLQNNQTRTQIAYPITQNSPKGNENPNVVSDIWTNNGLMESTIIRSLIYGGIVIVILVFFGSWATQIIHNNSVNTTPQMPMPNFTPQISPVSKQPEKGFMSLAMKKEKEADTSEKWYQVALAWARAEELYAKSESLASSDVEREVARKDKEFCNSRKLNAFKRSGTRF